MLSLPAPNDVPFPSNNRGAIARFWLSYWFWFFALLPWMLLRQLGISFLDLLGAVWTWNRRIDFGDGLSLIFMNNLRSLAVTTVFGERFATIQFHDVLIDPGPVFGRRRLRKHLKAHGHEIAAIVATHSHEEHIGSAPLSREMTAAPIFGTAITLAAVSQPERLSTPRRVFIGQPEPMPAEGLELLGKKLETERVALDVIESPGHCDGHASLFEPKRGVLFAGDSFLHAVFTCPNADVSGAEWIQTLEDYAQLPIRTMIGTHGNVFSIDEEIPDVPFLVSRESPLELIGDKLSFLRWARDVVAEGERRGLPYSVIEACLFPWQHWWSWSTWFRDEGSRLFSAGEFSRTHFVRSLSATPERVPPRFPPFARLVRYLSRRR